MNCVSRVFPNVHFEWLVKEVKRNLPVEMDFTREAHNMEKFTTTFKHLNFVKVFNLALVWHTLKSHIYWVISGGTV